MGKYIFLAKTEKYGDVEYFAIPESNIEILNVCDTYGFYGQQVSSSEAGDFLSLSTQKAVDFANQAYHNNHNEENEEVKQKWSIGDYISAYDFSEFDEILKSSLKEGVDYSVTYTECKGFNFWDGSNWKTIMVAHDNYNNFDWEVITDKSIIKRLRTAISKMKWHSKGPGYDFYKHGSVDITEFYWQGAWEKYRLIIN